MSRKFISLYAALAVIALLVVGSTNVTAQTRYQTPQASPTITANGKYFNYTTLTGNLSRTTGSRSGGDVFVNTVDAIIDGNVTFGPASSVFFNQGSVTGNVAASSAGTNGSMIYNAGVIEGDGTVSATGNGTGGSYFYNFRDGVIKGNVTLGTGANGVGIAFSNAGEILGTLYVGPTNTPTALNSVFNNGMSGKSNTATPGVGQYSTNPGHSGGGDTASIYALNAFMDGTTPGGNVFDAYGYGAGKIGTLELSGSTLHNNTVNGVGSYIGTAKVTGGTLNNHEGSRVGELVYTAGNIINTGTIGTLAFTDAEKGGYLTIKGVFGDDGWDFGQSAFGNVGAVDFTNAQVDLDLGNAVAAATGGFDIASYFGGATLLNISIDSFANYAALELAGYSYLGGGVFSAEAGGGNAAPEPATIALVSLGLAGLGFARARRRK